MTRNKEIMLFLLGCCLFLSSSLALAETPLETSASSSDASSDVVVEAEVEAVEEEEAPKWWNLTFSYQFSHNFARERPVAGNAFGIDPGFMTPQDISIGLHLGLSVSTMYPSGVRGGNDVTVNTVDGDPLSLSISRAFVIDPDYTGFTISTSLLQLFPFTSRTLFQVNQWYYAIKPGVALSLSKWGLSLKYRLGLQKNFHGQDYKELMGTGGRVNMTPLNSWSLSMGASLSYAVWKMHFSVGGGWSRAWRYHGVLEQPKNSVNFNAMMGIQAYDGLDISVGLTTAGPERLYGGFKSDHVLPLDPAFTTGLISVSYSI